MIDRSLISSISSQQDVSGWLIVKLAARFLLAAILALPALSMRPRRKRNKARVQFQLDCGKWVFLATIRGSDLLPSPASRRRKRKSTADPASSFMETTEPVISQPLLAASSSADMHAK